MATDVRPRPVLESGDRLSRAEFHARYCMRSDLKKAELVQGVVYVPAPTRLPQHGKPHIVMDSWIGAYALRMPNVEAASNATVFLGDDDEVQPDVLLFRTNHPDCRARLDDEGYIHGAPDLVVEVAASSASYDLHDKMESYRRAGVPEYLVWRTLDKAFDWFRQVDGQYVRVEPSPDGIIESHTFPGLRLPVAKLLAGDYAAVLAAVRPLAP